MPSATSRAHRLGPAKRFPTKDVQLTDEFRTALALLEGTDSCVFITGRAGTGKSTLLRYFAETTSKKTVVLAPTGVAAINAGGQTLHSFFRLPPRFIERDMVHRAGNNRRLIQEVDTVVIDEVSMVRADLMDAVDWALRLNRDSDVSFGGAQVVLFGDLSQLPPVVEQALLPVFRERYASPYFFDAQIFKKLPIKSFELTAVFRQKDAEFIGLLNRVRDNAFTKADIATLNKLVLDPADEYPEETVTLSATNSGAAAINQYRLNRLESEPFTYTAAVMGTFEESAYPTSFQLVLKPGAQVMMIRNDSEKRWVNGSIGTIRSLDETDITVAIGEDVYTVPRERWEKIRYTFNAVADRIEREVIGVFEQYPIKLAWAITIHKSQGQTLDRVIIDMERGAFAHGQLYVALSRCTSLEGIRLRTPLLSSDVIFDPQVLAFRQVR